VFSSSLSAGEHVGAHTCALAMVAATGGANTSPRKAGDVLSVPLGTKLDVVAVSHGSERLWPGRKRACVEVYVMRRSNRMKRILREQWQYFLPSTLVRGR
jgi:hypothetical protein